MQIKNRIITEVDVAQLNADKNSLVILPNTVGQSASVLKQLAPHVRIQIIGGYDKDKKPKYNAARIQKRTYYSPNQVSAIITKFEEYEKGIDPSWSDLEKAVYLYKKFGETIKYEDSDSVNPSNLNTVLGKGICAGMACVFKEAMDRQGIEADIINEPGKHTWNAIKIDGKWYPLDLTWDAENLKRGDASLSWFGQNPAFNKFKNHNAKGEEIIPNNCFNPQLIADALNKVTNSTKHQPIQQEENVEKLYSTIYELATTDTDPQVIRSGLLELSEFAFKIRSGYNDTAYVKEFDQKYGDLFRAIRENASISDEDKHDLLKATDSIWKDVMGSDKDKGLHSVLNARLQESLRFMNRIENADASKPDSEGLLQQQLQQIYDRCKSYGVVDMQKVQNALTIAEKKLEEMRAAQEKGLPVSTVKSQSQFLGPTEIIECRPTSEEKMASYIESKIGLYEMFLNGLRENGDNVQDQETQEIMSACNRALRCLYSHRVIEGAEEFGQGA